MWLLVMKTTRPLYQSMRIVNDNAIFYFKLSAASSGESSPERNYVIFMFKQVQAKDGTGFLNEKNLW
jgi:hypothetical protein